jgi:transcriptional regulator EpsA
LQAKPDIASTSVEWSLRPALTQAQRNVLDSSDLDRLLLIIDSSLKVRLRHHFFNWTQGAVQSLLPHDGLVCMLNEPRLSQPRIDFFTSMVIAEQDCEFLRRANGGLFSDLARNWLRHERRPMCYGRGGAQTEFDEAACVRFARLPFGRITAHGICGLNGEISCFFGLLGAAAEAEPRERYLVELLLPHFHATWLRVQSEQPPAVPAADEPIKLLALTARQIEIMRWVHEGKSNIEIGVILGLSALTVKNHVQKILRKLNVQNRTQAVTMCMSHNILRSTAHS